MIGIGELGLNLNSLNDSLASSMTVRDMYSNSNLNSASSLSWADDEVENYATMKVQHYLDKLEDFLHTGDPPSERCFNQSEAEQWKSLVDHFKLHNLLKESQRRVNEEQLRMNPIKKGLEIHGHSFVSLPPNNKYGISNTTMGYSHFQTPRIRSAYPVKREAHPIRIRSAHPMKSPPLPTIGLRPSTRSGNANERSYRSRSPSKNLDYMKILDDTARLSIHKNMILTPDEVPAFSHKTASPNKGYTPLKRVKLQPSALPRFTENGPQATNLPPLAEAKNSHYRRSKAKSKTTPAVSMTNPKSAYGNLKTLNGEIGYQTLGKKPTSAAQQNRYMVPQTKPGQHQHYRQTCNIPASTYRAGNSIELVGTSLSLFDPIARSVRPISIPKLRTTF